MYGEAGYMNKEEFQHFNGIFEEKGVTPYYFYNADYARNFYQKLPNSLYIKKSQKKLYAITNQMRDKNLVTEMVYTAADGYQAPILLIGKS